MATFTTGLWTSRLIPMPDCVEDAFAGINMEIYVDINGPSEFTMSDKLLNWDVTGKVDGLKVRPLLKKGIPKSELKDQLLE